MALPQAYLWLQSWVATADAITTVHAADAGPRVQPSPWLDESASYIHAHNVRSFLRFALILLRNKS